MVTKIISTFGIFLIGVIVLTAAPSQSAGINAANIFKDWSVHIDGKNKKKICYMHGEPKISKGKYKIRGLVYLQVAHRNVERTRNEVSIAAGYTYKKDSKVSVKIDKKSFKMFTNGATAWSQRDNELVAAMRAGTSMMVTGISKRGTVTRDKYSLAGFTAAHKAINRACGKK